MNSSHCLFWQIKVVLQCTNCGLYFGISQVYAISNLDQNRSTCKLNMNLKWGKFWGKLGTSPSYKHSSHFFSFDPFQFIPFIHIFNNWNILTHFDFPCGFRLHLILRIDMRKKINLYRGWWRLSTKINQWVVFYHFKMQVMT